MPDYRAREGMRVKMEAIPGLTDPLLLEAGYYFQCPPLETFGIDYAFTHTDYDTVRAGQFSRKGSKQLRVVNFDTLVVDWGTFTVRNQDVAIEDLTAVLVEILESGSPFLLTAAHQMPGENKVSARDNISPYGSVSPGYNNWSLELAGPEIQMAATLRTLHVEERAGEGDARYLSVQFVQYRDPVVPRLKKGKPTNTRPSAPMFPITGKLLKDGSFQYRKAGVSATLKTDKNASLAYLARRFYGRPEGARHIALENMLLDWGYNTPLIQHYRFRAAKGGPLVIPAPFDEAVVAP